MHNLTAKSLCVLLLSSAAAFGQQPAPVPQTMTDATVVQMVQQKIAPDLIILAISKCTNPRFALDPGSTQYMVQMGVTDEIFKAMAARQMGQPIPGYTPNPTPAQQAPAQPAPVSEADEYLHKGLADLSVYATAIIPHSSVSDTLGEVSLDVGYHVTRGNTVGANFIGIFVNGGQDYFIAGFYRYYVHTSNPKLYPFFGGAGGGNIAHASGDGTAGNFLMRGEVGIRYFLAKHVALDTSYNLVYVHESGVPFKYSSYSQIGIGAAMVF